MLEYLDLAAYFKIGGVMALPLHFKRKFADGGNCGLNLPAFCMLPAHVLLNQRLPNLGSFGTLSSKSYLTIQGGISGSLPCPSICILY
eukprot:831278-Pelagomonas_calceolata.AAC.3